MSWFCHECTYLNSSDQPICVMCERGYRFFSTQIDESELGDRTEDSAITNTDDDGAESVASETNRSVLDDSLLEPLTRREDIYIREDGFILHGEAAAEERKRSIARRKALDIQKLWHSSSEKTSASSFSTNFFQQSSEMTSATQFNTASAGHFNALNANLKGAHASATAMAEFASASALNFNATGANASAFASANVLRANAMNANVTGMNTSASATADVFKASVGNVNVTGAEMAMSASASVAKVNVGNISVTGASAGASASVNGTGVSAFNVCVSGPSAAASFNVDGAFSFGNVSVGLRPSFDIGWGLNLGIPFLSGSSGSSGSGHQNVQNAGEGNNPGDQAGAWERCQQRLVERFPNQRHYWRPAEFRIERNASGEPIDPTLTDPRLSRSDQENDRVNAAVQRHHELESEGYQFVGFKGGPKRDANGNLVSSSNPNPSGAAAPSENPDWAGMYTSPSPGVAGGYAMDDQGRPGQIDRVYLRRDAASSYYTDVGLNTPIGTQALRDVREHSNGRYIFSGPQHDTDPDLRAPETVTALKVRDEAQKAGNIRYVPSAHQIDRYNYRLEQVYIKELEASKMVPDYHVRMTKGPDDCARDGGRERSAHTFDGRPPYGYETQPAKKPELTDDDQLLMEECRKLGIDISADDLTDWKKNLRSDEEYEREEDRMQSSIAGATSSEQSKTNEEEEVDEDQPPEPCKDHNPRMRCMKCLQRTSGARIRNIHGQIHGFKFN